MAALAAVVKTPAAALGQQAAAAPLSDEAQAGALPLTHAEEAAEPSTAFLTAEELAALRRLGEVVFPRTRTPGALEAGAAEFLDLLLSQSSRERQALYREGLAKLNAESARRYREPFAKLGISQIDELLAPLGAPWTAQPPSDPLAAFLRAAKDDLVRATMSSRAWALATEGRRRGSGGTYWYPVE